MNRFFKYICLTFILSLGLFFSGLSSTKAMGTPDQKGNSNCDYLCTKDIVADAELSQSDTINWVIGIHVFRNTEGNYDGYAVSHFGTTFDNSLTTSDHPETIYFKNSVYNETFNNSGKLQKNFYQNGSWVCPSNIYSGYNQLRDNFTIYLEEKGGTEKCSRRTNSNNYPVQDGYKELDESTLYSDKNGNPVNDSSKLKKNDPVDTSVISGAYNSCYQVATGTNETKYYNSNGDEITKEEFTDQCVGYEKVDCSIFDDDLKSFFNKLFWVISIAGILLLVVMTMIEFIKALTGSDDSGLIKGFKHTLTRIIAVIILLLLPTIVTFILNLVNKYSSYTIGEDGNVTCGVGNDK